MTNDNPNSRERLTPEQRKTRDQDRRVQAEQAMKDHERTQKAVHSNLARLRAERIARETADNS